MADPEMLKKLAFSGKAKKVEKDIITKKEPLTFDRFFEKTGKKFTVHQRMDEDHLKWLKKVALAGDISMGDLLYNIVESCKAQHEDEFDGLLQDFY